MNSFLNLNRARRNYYTDVYNENFKNIAEIPHFNNFVRGYRINSTVYNLFFDLVLYIGRKMLIEASFSSTQSVSIFRTVRGLLHFVCRSDISRSFLERSCDDIQRYTNNKILRKMYFYFLSLFDFEKNVRLIRYFFEKYHEKPGIFFSETKNNYYFFNKEQYLFHVRHNTKKQYDVRQEEKVIYALLERSKNQLFDKTDSSILVYLYEIYIDFLIYAIKLISGLDNRFFIDDDKVYLAHYLDFYLFNDYEKDKLFIFTHTVLDFYRDNFFSEISRTIRIEVLYDCDFNCMNILFGFSEGNKNTYVSHGNRVVSYSLKEDFLFEQKRRLNELITKHLMKEKIDVFCTEII